MVGGCDRCSRHGHPGPQPSLRSRRDLSEGDFSPPPPQPCPITISFGPTLVQTGGDGQVAVAGTLLSAMANHLRQRLYISAGSDHGVAFAYLGTAFQAALPLGTRQPSLSLNQFSQSVSQNQWKSRHLMG